MFGQKTLEKLEKNNQASSLVKIPTPWMSNLYPTRTLMVDCYNLTSVKIAEISIWCARKNFLICAKRVEIPICRARKSKKTMIHYIFHYIVYLSLYCIPFSILNSILYIVKDNRFKTLLLPQIYWNYFAC